MTAVLSVCGAVKRFGPVQALTGVDLTVARGEILALLGDNGAGKSTLIKCISVVHPLDGGQIMLDGVPIVLRSPAHARAAGIETVYQDLALFDNLTPGQNFFAGREVAGPVWLPRALRFLQQRRMDAETTALLQRLGVTLPCQDLVVGMMSGGQRQAIAVARSAMFAQKLVVLDAPTAAMVLRQGRKVGELVPAANRKQDLVSMIVGA